MSVQSRTQADVTADPIVVTLSIAHSAVEILQYFIHFFPGYLLAPVVEAVNCPLSLADSVSFFPQHFKDLNFFIIDYSMTPT